MIHQFKVNNEYYTLDVYSGSIHITDEVSAEAIRLLEREARDVVHAAIIQSFGHQEDVTPQNVQELLDQIEALRQQGKLYTEDVYAARAGDLKNTNQDIKALCLHVAHTCNLCCSYCFAAQGKYKGDRALMPLSVGKRALDFLIENAGNRHNLEVDFFGGEPLMNWDVVKGVVAYGRELEQKTGKRFRFTLTTNGVLLNDEVTDFCNQEMQNVVLSLDGRRETHDRFRVDAKGRGSYDTVVPKFQRFVEKRGDKSYYIRGTYTRHNLDFVQDILHMAELGFKELSMEPVVAAEDDPCALQESDLPYLFGQYELLASEMLKRYRAGKPFTFYHYTLDLEHGPCIYKRISGCGSGTEYLAVTPWGELFPCHQFVGDAEYSMGDIWQGIQNHARQEEFRHCNLYSHAECSQCWAKLFCAGGCAANHYHATGSINGVHDISCQLFKKRTECAIALNAALQNDDNES